MKRFIPFLAAAATLLVAACGNASAASTSSPSPSAGAANAFRGGASGQLVQINAQTLILTGPNGDITVTYSSSTTVSKTAMGGLADITVGSCAVATGRKDTSGMITATSVRVSPRTASGCAAPTRALSPAPGASPRPSPSPRPSGQAPANFVSGEVTAVSGTTVTILTSAGASQAITVPLTAIVSRTAPASLTDLQTGQCLSANGPRDASGNVQATSLTISPAGPSGTCTTRFGRGNGPFGGAPSTTATPGG